MTYALVAVFLLTGKHYVERRHMPLATCAGRLALLRTELMRDMPKLEPRIGRIEYRCLPEVVS